MNKFGTDKILIVILAGVLLMAAAFPSGHSSASKESSTTAIESESMSTDMYEEYVEKRLEKILADVDGVGKVKVMLSIRNSTEKVLAHIQRAKKKRLLMGAAIKQMIHKI